MLKAFLKVSILTQMECVNGDFLNRLLCFNAGVLAGTAFCFH